MNKVVLPVICAFFILINTYAGSLSNGLSENLVRLHVVANSDSPEDQALKEDVRDCVLEYMEKELEGTQDIEESKAVIADRLNDIKEVVENEIAEHGSDENIQVMLGEYMFPTKAYGDIVLPAGSYQALRVVIGDGVGSNWWCVLFPPLCFVDVTHGEVPASSKEDLRGVLSEEEYRIVVSADEERDVPIKIKFKIVELIQDSKRQIRDEANKGRAFFSTLFSLGGNL